MKSLPLITFTYKGDEYAVWERPNPFQTDDHDGKCYELAGPDGDTLVTTTSLWEESMYKILLGYGISMFQWGERVGRLHLQSEIRNLLNVPFLEANPS